MEQTVRWIRVLMLAAVSSWLLPPWALATTPADPGVTLEIGQRPIHTFRASLGTFTPAERAEAARRRMESALTREGEGWVSVKPMDQGLQIELDGQPLFMVIPGDAQPGTDESPQALADQAARQVNRVWDESRERSDDQAIWTAIVKVGLATLALLVALLGLGKLTSRGRVALKRRLHAWLESPRSMGWHSRTVQLLPGIVDRAGLIVSWLTGLLVFFLYLTFVLERFAVTRPAGETLAHSISEMSLNALTAVAEAIPGMFIAVGIFLMVWVATRISTELFERFEHGQDHPHFLNAHTAPATRRIVNAVLWLFAVAMAYPYLPGSQTEAFKGLTVMVGLMVSIGASGVVGQIASGIMVVYNHSLKKGEYVRIQECEGTVIDIGLFVTRLRTGMGEEIALPNALVLGNVTRNFSRAQTGAGFVLDTTVTIGYDTPWRQVHAILIEATTEIAEIKRDPAPAVMQTALGDFYVSYRLVVHVQAESPSARAQVTSDLHAAIQDAFNRHDVQIMSPHYLGDPSAPKTVPPSAWYLAPAKAPGKKPA